MGIAPYKYFTYDGKSSRDYDVYLTGEGVFNAPERAVEMVEIPGRNGNYALDQGKFNNITVTYKAGIVDVSESNFANKVSAVRNWLCSKVGYKRLSDDYNPNEYRMAVYKSGVNIDHVDLKTGEFEITFDCKPQRWLTSGETAVAVADGGTLDNPTPFEAEPLLAVDGYGTIGFNGYSIEIENVPIGITLLSAQRISTNSSFDVALEMGSMANGDSFDISCESLHKFVINKSSQKLLAVGVPSVTDCTATKKLDDDKNMSITQNVSLSCVYGTSASVTGTATCTVVGEISGTGVSTNASATCTISYDGDSTITYTVSSSGPTMFSSQKEYKTTSAEVYGNSTKLALGNPTWIDCEIGECYMESGGEIVSLNGVISLGSDLPKLSSGTNTFALDNTITQLEVTPRYWKV